MNSGANPPGSSAPPTSPPANSPALAKKPRFALFVATACGLGYIPFAPGTFGSLAGLVITVAPFWALVGALLFSFSLEGIHFSRPWWVSLSTGAADPLFYAQAAVAVLLAAVGVWSGSRAAKFWAVKDPQRVVVDEVSGQHLTLLLGCGLPIAGALKGRAFDWQLGAVGLGLMTARTALSWKYLLLGFILFRVFDIWKPFPVRQAERLPGGWGIMADDWVAALYAGLGLWLARAAGL